MQVAQEGQITERFTRAIEQLGSEKMAIRLGGIYALERIANDSDKDYWPIIETLTAYVRERARGGSPLRLRRRRRREARRGGNRHLGAGEPQASHGYSGNPHCPGPAQVPLRPGRE